MTLSHRTTDRMPARSASQTPHPLTRETPSDRLGIARPEHISPAEPPSQSSRWVRGSRLYGCHLRQLST